MRTAFLSAEKRDCKTSYQVGRRFKVFLEPKIRIYGKERMQDNVPGERKHQVMSLNAGTSFSF